MEGEFVVNEFDHIVLDAKLRRHDEFSQDAIEHLVMWMTEYPEEIIAVARGRHVQGHILYGDRNYKEWSDERLQSETMEEIADGVNYFVEILQRRKYGQRPN